MSRGFVKEEDQEEIPIVPPRADLPDGITNYVTQVGMDALLEERRELMQQKDNLDLKNENEKRIATNYLQSVLQLLNGRIATAQVVDIKGQLQDEVRFGATVTLKIDEEKTLKQYQIVGVDEADIGKGKISFISPIARTLIHKKPGEQVVLKLMNKEKKFLIKEITYQ